MCLTEFSDKGFNSFRDRFPIHIRQAIKNIDGRIEFGKKVNHFGFHPTIPGKAKVNNGII